MDRRLRIALADDGGDDFEGRLLDVIPGEALVAAQFLAAEQVDSQGEGSEEKEDEGKKTAHARSIAEGLL